ncbi:HAD hydrolase-like protein [Candidatus Woesearchaeota archaeon]|jgi:predicted HAD superfamily phosphohydrolase YqeG|nr:HAD hydrolase-like protein [Candidatus Woesearchaeota archaeon]
MTLKDSVDLLDTAIQYLRMKKQIVLSEHLLADKYVSSINEVTPEFLEEQGIEAIIWDVDGTLMGYHGTEVDHSVRKAYEALIGFKQAILSNSGEGRFRQLGFILDNIPVVRIYENKKDPGDVIVREIVRKVDYLWKINELDEEERLASYDLIGMSNSFNWVRDYRKHISGYRALKKPNPKLIEYAMRIMGIDDVSKVAMIGDKASTDIIGGNMAGVYTIQIFPPLKGWMDKPLVKSWARPREERLVLQHLREAGRQKDVDRITRYKMDQKGYV